MKSKAWLAFVVVLFSMPFLLSCGGAKPYRLAAQAARSPERPLVFVHDKRLRLKLRGALVLAVPDSALSISPYVTGGRGYLVGWVKDEAERSALEQAARSVPGLLSLAVYLPVKPTGEQAPDSTRELELKAKVVGALLATGGSEKINIAVEVLGTQAILVGAVRSTDDIQKAEKAASDTSGISGVTTFMSIPQASDAKRFGGFLP